MFHSFRLRCTLIIQRPQIIIFICVFPPHSLCHPWLSSCRLPSPPPLSPSSPSGPSCLLLFIPLVPLVLLPSSPPSHTVTQRPHCALSLRRAACAAAVAGRTHVVCLSELRAVCGAHVAPAAGRGHAAVPDVVSRHRGVLVGSYADACVSVRLANTTHVSLCVNVRRTMLSRRDQACFLGQPSAQSNLGAEFTHSITIGLN